MRRLEIIGILGCCVVIVSLFVSVTASSRSQAPAAEGILFEFIGEAGADKLGMVIIATGDLDDDGIADFAAGVPYHDGAAGIDSGLVILYSGADRSILRLVEGPIAGERFGDRLCRADDVTGDGAAEILVGVPYSDCNGLVDCGRIYVVSGGTGEILSSIDGKQEAEHFGAALARIGDLTGDEVAEIMIGAPLYDGPKGVNSGRAYIYTMQGKKIIVVPGQAPDERFGQTLGALGYTSSASPRFILIGAPRHTEGSLTEAGRIYVYMASNAQLLTTLDGQSAMEHFGHVFYTDGDFNGDNHFDILVGAPGFQSALGPTTGKAYVISGLDITASREFVGEAARDHFGESLGSVKDLDGDLCDEILIGAPQFDTQPSGAQNGRVYLFSGKTGELRFTFEGTGQGTFCGTGLSGIADITSDGIGDVLAGAPSHDHTLGNSDSGRIHILSGDTGEELDTIDGLKGGDQFGFDVSGGYSDVDGDGLVDFIIGAFGHNDYGQEYRLGRVYVYSAADGQLIQSVDGDEYEAKFGSAVSSLGDVSGDGLGDFLVGAPYHDHDSKIDCGRVYLYLAGNPNPTLTLTGENSSDLFGFALCRVDDLNGDGFPDFLVGARGYDNSRGKVYLYSGADGELLYYFFGKFEGDEFGRTIAAEGDIDNDGVPDIAIGAPGYDGTTLLNSGAVYLYSGATGTWLKTLRGENTNDHFGAVSIIGDITGDGHCEILVGAPLFNGTVGPFSGAAYVFSGATAEQIYFYEGETIRANFGIDVVGIGDADDDGVSDFSIGAYYNLHPLGLGDTGRVYVYSGADGSLIKLFDGDDGGDQLGISVAPAGDVNQDSYADIISGAHLYNHGETGYNAGKVFVLSAAPSVE